MYKKLRLLTTMLLFAVCCGTWAQTASVGDNLWMEEFKGGSGSTTFSATSNWNSSLHTTMLNSDDANSLTYASSNAMANNGSASNMSGAHVWLNKNTTGYISVSGIPLYNASKVKISWAQAGSSKVSVSYAFDGETTFTELSSNSSAATEFMSDELIVEGHTTINLKFQRTSTSTNVRIDNLKLQVTEVISSELTASDLNLANAPVSLNFDLYNSSAAQTISYTTSSTGTVSVANSDYATFVVDQTNKTITVTPTAVTNGAQTITVNQAADETYAAGSVNFTVNVTDSRPTYTVTYKANGGVGDDIVKTYRQGTDVTIEGNTFTYAGHSFVKWNTAANGTGTDYQVDGSIENIQANVELFAQWEEVYEVTYDFTQIDGFSDWTSSYSEHVVDYADATVTFASANKQTSTITNQPVTKGGDVELVMTDGSTLATATFVCTQWGTKEQTITLHYSTDGGENYTSTDITSEDFTISSDNLPAGTNAVKITFSSNSNQVGIASASVLKVPEIEITNNNEIAYNATSGSFNFSITHPAGGTMTVSEDVDWISNAAISGNTVTFTTTANKELSQARNGVITLTYTYNGNKTVTEEVTVTQAAASTATITLNAACTDGTLIYGTYYSDKAYVMNDMLEGQVVSVDADGKLVVETAYEGGDVVPANTALLIATADEFTGTKEYTITLSTGGDDWSEYNMLKGTLSADDMTVGENCLFYRLTMHNGKQIGFWWGAENGGAFKPGANKAYLILPTSKIPAPLWPTSPESPQPAPGYYYAGILGVSDWAEEAGRHDETAPRTYNLKGQLVDGDAALPKGVYIRNGRKVIVK